MALSFVKLFQPVLLSTGATSIYAVPASPTTTLLRNARVRLTNATVTAAAVTLNAVPAAGSVTASNVFLSAVSIAPGGSLEVDVPQLAAGDALWGLAGAAVSVNIQATDGVLQS